LRGSHGRRFARHALQEGRKVFGVELGHAGGAVATRLLARRNEQQPGALDLLQGRLSDAGLWRVALVVGGVDGEERCRDFSIPDVGS
jgi:hypothetical protein